MATCKTETYDVDDDSISMSDMKPGQIGIIVSIPHTKISLEKYVGHLVMRSLSIDNYEVMDLTKFTPDACWTGKPSRDMIRVRLCRKPVRLVISNV